MTQYHEYPKTMTHPAHAPARASRYSDPVIDEWDDEILGSEHPIHGTPERLPPVTVHNEDQEERYRALGYTAPGTADRKAFEKAHAAPEPLGHEHCEWPKYVEGELCQGPDEARVLEARKLSREYPKFVCGVVVNSPEEEEALPEIKEQRARKASRKEAEEKAELVRLLAKHGMPSAVVHAPIPEEIAKAPEPQKVETPQTLAPGSLIRQTGNPKQRGR